MSSMLSTTVNLVNVLYYKLIMSVNAQPASSSLDSRLEAPVRTLPSTNVVLSHTNSQSHKLSVVASSPSQVPASFAETEVLPKCHTEASERLVVRMTKHGDTLGFGVRQDTYKRLQVSAIQDQASPFCIGDILLSVNGENLIDKQPFSTAIQYLKSIQPGDLVFEIERRRENSQNRRTEEGKTRETTERLKKSDSKAISGVQVNHETVARTAFVSPSEGSCPSIPVSGITGPPQTDGAFKTKKRARPIQRKVTIMDENGQPVNVTALVADLAKERQDKAALEEKNASLRKRLQSMLIEKDQVRVQAQADVASAEEKAKREITEAQRQVTLARAQLRLQDRGPDVKRTDSIVNELLLCKTQLEKLKKAQEERTNLLMTRYRVECRLAIADAQRILDAVVEKVRTKLRQIGRMRRDDSPMKPDVEIACEGVRRLTFMTLFNMTHDFGFYSSAAFHALEPVQYLLDQRQAGDVFGTLLCHEERAGLFYVAMAPMVALFDPSTETLSFKCQWEEQNALHDLARNFRSQN